MRARVGLLAAVVVVLCGAGAASASAATDATEAQRAGPDLTFRSDAGLAEKASSKPIGRSGLARKLRRLARRAPGPSGFYVYDVEANRNRVLFDKAEGKRRKLASNQKLFTTTTALAKLGSKERIATRVKASGSVTGAGRLKGNLYLVGAGDPSLGRSGIADLARDVKRSGIESVKGRVFGDDTIFDRRRGVADSGYGPSPYIAPLGGLTYGGSTYAEDPAKHAARAFRDKLRRVGVRVGGRVKVGAVPRKLRGRDPIGEHESATIAELAAQTNKPSDNFYAEMLLKRIAAEKRRRGTTRGGARIVEGFARQLRSNVSAKDGSGLTASNRSSPRDVVKLLVNARREGDIAKPLFKSLAVAGKEGTLDDRMQGTAAAGECRGKTGTIDGVSNLSGYCKSGDELVAFSLLMNGVGSYDSARGIQDRMVVEIARYVR